MVCSIYRRRIMILGIWLTIFCLVGCQGPGDSLQFEEPHSPAEIDGAAGSDPDDSFTWAQELGDFQSWDLDLGDLDGDGDLDLFISSLGDADPKIWFNDGLGNLSAGDQLIPGCSKAVLGDINGDGRLDLIIAEWEADKPVWTDLLSIWLGEEDGNFSFADHLPVPEQTQGMILGDFNADQALDLFVLGTGQDQVWLNDGEGDFELVNQDLATGIDAAGAAADLDGDGDLDVLAGGWEGPPALWLNDGAGFFSRQGISIRGEDLHIHGMAVGDLDGDGDLDAFVTLANGDPHQVWVNEGEGEFVISQTLPAPLGHAVALGDLDGDGDLDAVTGHGFRSHGSVRFWINDGEGLFSGSSLVLWVHFTGAVAVGDLDLDDDLDIVAAQNEWDAAAGPPDLVWLNQDQPQKLQGTE